MRALPMRNTLFWFRCPSALGTPLAPHLDHIFEVGPKLAPKGGLGGLLEDRGMDLENVFGGHGGVLGGLMASKSGYLGYHGYLGYL